MNEAYLSSTEREVLIALLTESRDATVAAVEPLSDAQWSFRASDDRWTIGENIEHLGLVERRLFELIQKTLSRPPNPKWQTATAGKSKLIERMLLDRSSRRNAPDPVLPTGQFDRTMSLRVYQEQRRKLLQFASDTKEALKEHTADHQRPVFGTLNVHQWLLFVALHNLRHVKQIAEVKREPIFSKC